MKKIKYLWFKLRKSSELKVFDKKKSLKDTYKICLKNLGELRNFFPQRLKNGRFICPIFSLKKQAFLEPYVMYSMAIIRRPHSYSVIFDRFDFLNDGSLILFFEDEISFKNPEGIKLVHTLLYKKLGSFGEDITLKKI